MVGSRPMLLGRARELSELRLAFDAAKEARGSVHVLVGEPGIGKTRLADEAARAAAEKDLAVAWGRAWETAGAPPFFPWSEALDSLSRGSGRSPDVDLPAPDLGPHAFAGGDRA